MREMREKMTVSEAYSRDIFPDWPDVLGDLFAKYKDRDYVVARKGNINNVFRAVLVFDCLKKNFPKGGSVIDIGCGIGYVSHYLAKNGYDLRAFDASDVGIRKARALARQIGVDEKIFVHQDHTYLEKVPSDSVDAALAMGFLYYLDEDTRDYCYRQVHRILKKGGRFLATGNNKLFSSFALNDTTLKFWAQMIDDFSPVSKLLAPKTTLEALSEKVKVPKRVFEKKSISRRFKILEDNPLTFNDDVRPYGFEVEEILYPDSHLLTPALEAEVDQDELLKLKARYCIQKARDWRGIFMCYEFLAIMRKKDD
jgi:SAM-dependent methyltransferase